MPEIPDRNRVNVVARSHYGIRPQAFKHWNDAAPRLLAQQSDNEIFVYGLILPHEEVTFLRMCFDDETAMSGKMFREALEKIDGDVTLRINSDGGDVFEAATMLTAIRERQSEGHAVNCVVDGIAASAASLLASAADRTEMGELSFVMIHEAAGGVYGRADDFERGAKLLNDLNASAAKVYAKRTGMAEDEIRTMMGDETYLSASDAVEKGFADAIAEAPVRDDPAMIRVPVMARRTERLAAVLAAITRE